MSIMESALLHLETEGLKKTNEINLFLLHPNKECARFTLDKWSPFNSAVIENE